MKDKGDTNMDNNNKSFFAPFFEVNNTPIIMKMGNTTFEITTHFNKNGRETVLQQFEDLLTEMKAS
ncbi:hypothetical protein [Ligilactobacillus ruminis]|uniref:hypothetical protein n=1 Tax=Ligilactobacillus ruminis TaxID=1623 RepID=UPI0022E3B3F8|nr:hypothetical protein [Ligilactobacillus ruminis]